MFIPMTTQTKHTTHHKQIIWDEKRVTQTCQESTLSCFKYISHILEQLIWQKNATQEMFTPIMTSTKLKVKNVKNLVRSKVFTQLNCYPSEKILLVGSAHIIKIYQIKYINIYILEYYMINHK